MRRTLVSLLVAVCVASFALPTVGASAGTITYTDPNDSRSTLDLAGLQVGHVSDETHVFTFRMHRRLPTRLLMRRNGWVSVGLDTKDPNLDDRRIKFEYWVDIVLRGGRLRGDVWSEATDEIVARGLKAQRVDLHTVRVRVPLRLVGDPSSYFFVGYSVSFMPPFSSERPGMDWIPNHFAQLRMHDFTGPKVAMSAGARFSTDLSTTLQVPFSFWVRDDRYGSGIESWALRSRSVGTTDWTTHSTGSSDGRFTRSIVGEQGQALEVAVQAIDLQGNATQGPIRMTTVPYDDTDPEAGLTLTYGPSAESWIAAGGVDGAFLGTTHASTPGDTVEISFTGSGVCLIGSSGSAQITYVLDGGAPTQLSLAIGLGPRLLGCIQADPGTHTVAVTIESGDPVLDAIAVEG